MGMQPGQVWKDRCREEEKVKVKVWAQQQCKGSSNMKEEASVKGCILSKPFSLLVSETVESWQQSIIGIWCFKAPFCHSSIHLFFYSFLCSSHRCSICHDVIPSQLGLDLVEAWKTERAKCRLTLFRSVDSATFSWLVLAILIAFQRTIDGLTLASSTQIIHDLWKN